MTNIALLSFGVVGVAFGRCWRYTAEKDLREDKLQNDIELTRALKRIDRQHEEILKLRRHIATVVSHPSAPRFYGPVVGSDDEALAGRQQ